MTTSRSTFSSAGPSYFIVASPISASDEWSAPYFDTLLQYQARMLSQYLEKASEENSKNPTTPTTQITPRVASEVSEYVSRLEPFAHLPAGWDGPGTKGPTIVGVWQAVLDSYRLIAIGLPAPTPKILPDGTLGVFWRHGRHYAAIDFEEDGVHVWTVTDGNKYWNGTWDATAQVPTVIRSAVKAQGTEQHHQPLHVLM